MRWLQAMMMVLLGVGPGWAQTTKAEVEARLKADEQMLRAANLKNDGPALLQFFRDRTLSQKQVDVLAAKVLQLGSVSYFERQQAEEDLKKEGDRARPVLHEALKQADTEVVRRVELCLRRLAGGHEAVLAAAAARLLAHHKPAGAPEVILNYLPFAIDESVVEELQTALTAVAVRDGQADPAIVRALDDNKPVKRAVAAAALVRAGARGHFASVRDFLKDSEIQVRSQVACALTDAGDKSALPVLIDLIAELPACKVWHVEEMLNRLAGDDGPDLMVDGKTPAAKVRDAWKTWFAKFGPTLDLAKLHQPPPLKNLTLITQMDPRAGLNGKVYELKPDKSVHWEITGLRYPVDALVIRRDRVLICEYLSRRVTERDFKGNILWECSVNMPISCQRLPNGNTFIAGRASLAIVDRDKKEVFTYLPPGPSIAAAAWARDGHMVLVTSGGLLQRLDAKGNVVKSFNVGPVYTMGGNIDILPGGRVLIPQWRDNRVAEYDAHGKLVWSAKVVNPTSAVRLANGNTLVVSMNQQRAVELNPAGQEVWTFQTNGRPWRARKR